MVGFTQFIYARMLSSIYVKTEETNELKRGGQKTICKNKKK